MQINLKNTKTICISLDTATERRNNIKILMETLGYTNWEFFNAIKGKDIAEGCAKSHMEVLKNHNFSEPLLLIEDDIATTPWYSDIIDFEDTIDALYIGYSAWAWEKQRAYMSTFGHNTTVTKQNNFYKIERMLSTHAILYLTQEYAERAIFAMNEHLTNPNSNRHCDVALGNLQEFANVYATPHSFFYQNCKYNKLYTLVSIENTLNQIKNLRLEGKIVEDLQ